MEYFSVLDTKGEETYRNLNSDTLNHFFIQSAVSCRKQKEPKACQALANLCVLQLYDYSRATTCRFFRTELMDEEDSEVEHFGENSDSGWKQNLPWLYYEDTPRKTLRTRRRFNMRQAFDKDHASYNRFKYLRFYLARYSIDGEY